MSTVFHKTPPPWFDKVKSLKPGEKRRIQDGKLVSFNGEGYHLYDFRDKQSEVYSIELSLAEKLALITARREQDNRIAADASPPPGGMYHPSDWPAAARVWMYQAGFNNDTIQDLGAYWHAGMQRVVIPYATVLGQQAWIARRVSGGGTAGPKYLFPNGIARGGGAYISTMPHTEVVIITEDLLSARRAAVATGMDAVAAQGTSLDTGAILALNHRYERVAVWLDPDKWGRLGAARIAADFRNVGKPVANIGTDKDPKYYTDEQIVEVFNGAAYA